PCPRTNHQGGQPRPRAQPQRPRLAIPSTHRPQRRPGLWFRTALRRCLHQLLQNTGSHWMHTTV
ncbi:hypothetical protein BGZ82_010074, partial [Podila clonocystis]